MYTQTMQLREDRLTAAADPKYTSRTTQLNSKLTAAATSQKLFVVDNAKCFAYV